MAADDPTKPLPTPGTNFSTRLFSTEVAIVQANQGEPVTTTDWAYEFSNGRRFSSKPASPPETD